MEQRRRLRARDVFERVFPERQIYHRSGGTVRFVSLSPWRQALLATGAAAVVGWSVYATVKVVLQGHQSWTKELEAEKVKDKYERWLQEARAKESAALALLDERTAAFQRATVEFENRHETLKTLLGVAGGIEQSPSETTRATLSSNGSRILSEVTIDEADPREGRSKLAFQDVGDATVASNQLSGRLERLRAEQSAFLDQAEDAAVARTEKLRGVLRMTGVGVARAVGEEGGVGGPLVELGPELTARLTAETDPEFAKRVAQVAARLQEMRTFENVARSTPLAVPVQGAYRQTSGYGLRFDPFNRRPAFHAGLDFAGAHGAPIVAGAPGTVSFAGVRSGYGYVVEIDHGHGFKTRYAHLSAIFVRVGDRIGIGTRVGAMGSTGRSTGTHLHYEVWFRGQSRDPMNFLKAGRYVHEG